MIPGFFPPGDRAPAGRGADGPARRLGVRICICFWFFFLRPFFLLNKIVPAKQLGMKTVWIKQEFEGLWTVTNESEKSDIEVNSLSDILNYL